MGMKMAKYRLGRMALHVACILRGGNLQLHWAGVLREFARE